MPLLDTATGILSANKSILFSKYPIKEYGCITLGSRLSQLDPQPIPHFRPFPITPNGILFDKILLFYD